MRDYGRVHTAFWCSSTIATLSDDGKLLALYLLTCQHNTIAGVFRLPDGYVAEDIGWDEERVVKAFAELFQKGFANRCRTTKWVWVSNHLEWNPPENPNQFKAALKVAQSIPEKCVWRQHFISTWGAFLGMEMGNPYETPPQPFRNQEQEQEQEQEQDFSDLSVTCSRPPVENRPELVLVNQKTDPPEKPLPQGPPECPHQRILALWGEILPSMPQHIPGQWKGARAEHLRTRWRETAEREKWVDVEQGVTYFRRLFSHIARSPFLMGRTARRRDDGGRAFMVELGWLVKFENWVKVHEGKYHPEAAA